MKGVGMLSTTDRIIIDMLGHNLERAATSPEAIQEVLRVNDQLLAKLTLIDYATLAADEQLLIQNIQNKFQHLLVGIEQQKNAVQAQIMTMTQKKSTVAAYMQYDAQATFINRDV